MDKDSLRPVLLELGNVILPVKKAEVAAPCRKVILDRQLCRTLQMDTVAKCPLETGELSQKRTLVPKKRLERKRTRLSVLEKDIRQEVASNVTTEGETEVVHRRQNTLTDKDALRRPPTTWNSRTSDRSGLRCIPGEVLKMGGTPRKRCRDRRNGRRNVHLDEKRVRERTPGELGRTVGQCVGKQLRCRRGAEYLEKPPELATNSMIGKRVPAAMPPSASQLRCHG